MQDRIATICASNVVIFPSIVHIVIDKKGGTMFQLLTPTDASAATNMDSSSPANLPDTTAENSYVYDIVGSEHDSRSFLTFLANNDREYSIPIVHSKTGCNSWFLRPI